MRVLIIGGTGYLGGKIARAAAHADHDIVALVRPQSDAAALEGLGAAVVRGDITDPRTLPAALDGIDTVVTSTIGYTARRPGDSVDSVDNWGNRNLADAALTAGVARLVFVSVLTADKATSVPHFHQKFLSEQYFAGIGLPFVALRPGGFLDQILGWGADGIIRGTLDTLIDPDVPLTCIHADDVAHDAVAALALPGIDGARIDLGMEHPLTFRGLADELSRVVGHSVAVRYSPPSADADSGVGAEIDAALAYMGSGQYVADIDAQVRVFGPAPTLAASVRRWAEDAHLTGGARIASR